MAGRFIKLYDKILKWEWYQHAATLCLFVHLLLKANYRDGRVEGRKVLRGQLVTSLPKLATGTGLTIQQVRTALEHLKSTGEITDESTNRYRIITVVKYDDYQAVTEPSTDKQQANNRLSNSPTTDQATPNIEYIEKNRIIDSPTERGRAPRFTPPTREELETFCWENRLGIDVDRFLDYYTANGWMAGKNHMRDWKATARNWARRDESEKRKPAAASVASGYEQRSYSGFDGGSFMDQLMKGDADV